MTILLFSQTDQEAQARLAAFLQGLQEAGWGVGRSAADNLRYTARLNAFTPTEREDRIKLRSTL